MFAALSPTYCFRSLSTNCIFVYHTYLILTTNLYIYIYIYINYTRCNFKQCYTTYYFLIWCVLKTYFYVIGISFDKTHFTCIWLNLSRFKMIITNGYIEDMKIAQELLKKSAICRSRYLLDRNSICWDSLKLDTCLNLLSLRDLDYSQQRFYYKRLFVNRFV